MDTTELSPREQQVMDLLRDGGGRRSLDEMVIAITTEESPVRRQGVTQTIKNLNNKLARIGKFVVLDSGGRGRGNKAVYKLVELKRKRR